MGVPIDHVITIGMTDTATGEKFCCIAAPRGVSGQMFSDLGLEVRGNIIVPESEVPHLIETLEGYLQRRGKDKTGEEAASHFITANRNN